MLPSGSAVPSNRRQSPSPLEASWSPLPGADISAATALECTTAPCSVHWSAQGRTPSPTARFKNSQPETRATEGCSAQDGRPDASPCNSGPDTGPGEAAKLEEKGAR